jgi:predicted RNA-binding Zn-ribbon protein involved in translation (DUF1610 family)
MPEFRYGKGKTGRLCDQCGKPFIKTARVQKNCPKCRAKNIKRCGNYGKSYKSS